MDNMENNRHRNLHKECIKLLKKDWVVDFKHVYRETNIQAAAIMANLAMGLSRGELII